jgi:hypothetical protein
MARFTSVGIRIHIHSTWAVLDTLISEEDKSWFTFMTIIDI